MDTTKPIMYYHYAGLTNTGMLRDHNEDAFKLPLETDTKTLASKGHLYVLADGMGGHQKGEVASAVTIKTVTSEYYATIVPLDVENREQAIIRALTSAIEKANTQVMEVTEGGGTTVVAAVFHGDFLTIVNVGDSRAYLLRDNELRLVSRDHSLVSRLVEMGKITEEEALTHPRRNVLYQALGQGSDVELHIFSVKLQLDDVVILCSDGLWGEVGEPAIKEVLTSVTSPVEATKRLIDMANASGGSDNITAIIVRVTDEKPPDDQYVTKAGSTGEAATDLDDTKPSPTIRHRPDTLPEGKFHTSTSP